MSKTVATVATSTTTTTTTTTTAVNTSAQRGVMRDMIAGVLAATDTTAAVRKVIVENAEKGIFNAAIEISEKGGIRPRWDVPLFEKMYRNVGLRVMSNIDPDSYVHNTGLLQRLLDREFMPHEMAFLGYPEMFPDIWRDPQERINKKIERAYEIDKSGTSDQFKCPRCKKSECTYFDLQTRSADEGMCRFVTCINCKKRWKE